MARYRLSVRARSEIADIARYTESRWGRDQRNEYLAALRDRLDLLATHPEQGMSRESLRAGYRSIAFRSHVIFFRAVRPIEIARVLHKRMDPAKHLGGARQGTLVEFLERSPLRGSGPKVRRYRGK